MLVQVGKRFVSEQHEIESDFSKGMRELLSRSKVFQHCHDEFIRELIVSSNRKEYAPNRYLLEEGQRGSSMFVLYKGVVEVTANGRYVCKLTDGSLVGEAALLSINNRRTASVRSVQKCDVAIIFRSAFHSILEKYPWEKRKFQRDMKGKMVELGKQIDLKDDMNLEQQAIHCDLLKKVPFFASEEESMDGFLSELAMSGTSKWYRPGKVIIQEGDTHCDEMYVLLRGAVQLTACGEHLGRLENDLFGEICVLDLLERRTASVIAATQCHCMVFARQVVIPVLSKYPDARMRLLEHARQRLVALNAAISDDKQAAVARSAPGLQTPRVPGTAVGFGSVVDAADSHMFTSNSIFADARVDLIQQISSAMATERVQEGVVVLKEGDPVRPETDFVYWIAKGQAEVWKNDLFVTILDEGDTFGELAIFATSKREATVKARTRLVLRAVRGHLLKEILNRYKDETLAARWESQMEHRSDQLKTKESLLQKTSTQPPLLDFMFMKVHKKGQGGVALPANQSLQGAFDKMGPLTILPALPTAAPLTMLPALSVAKA